jgi:UDP-N-acetylmuramate dehydrogenase
LTSTILQCDNREIMSAALQTRAQELLERRHRSQPKLRSAGSIFKNPPNDFAGRLIEACGLKGTSIGAAQISDVHANFIVNRGGALAADVVTLATQAHEAVLAKFGVRLEWEVRRVGAFSAVQGRP